MAPPLTALYRQVQPPAGASLAVACSLVSGQSHLVTAHRSRIDVYQLDPHTDQLVLLSTRSGPGHVFALDRVRTPPRGPHRLLAAFHPGKLALLEWDPHRHALVPVSLHSFDKLPQVVPAEDPTRLPPLLAVDPASRLAALLLPTNSGGDATLALLPFFTDHDDDDDDDDEERDRVGADTIPYAPSHLVPLASLTTTASAATAATTATRSSTLPSAGPATASNAFVPGSTNPPPIRNVVSMCFLPGFTEPTLALLYAPEWTWSGRLEHLAHNYLVSLVTLSTNTTATSSSFSTPTAATAATATRATLISTSPPLPYSCQRLTPCPASFTTWGAGGVLVTTANGLLHLDQSGRIVAAPVNGWLARDYPPGRARPPGLEPSAASSSSEEELPPPLCEKLEGAQIVFLTSSDDDDDDDDDKENGGPTSSTSLMPPRALVWLTSGRVLSLSFVLSGRAVAALVLDSVEPEYAGLLTGSGASALVRIPGGGGRRRRLSSAEEEEGKKSRGRKRSEGLVLVTSESSTCALLRWTAGTRAEHESRPGLGQGNGYPHTSSAAAAEEDVEMDEGEHKPLPSPPSPPPPAPGADLPSAATRQHRDVDEFEMDFDEDDIYGDSTNTAAATATGSGAVPSPAALAQLANTLGTTSGAGDDPFEDAGTGATAAAATGRLELQVLDTIAGYGAIRSLVMGLVDDESPAELVAATGAGESAGLTVFHRNLYPQARRPVSLHSTLAPPAEEETIGSMPPFTPTTGLWRVVLAARPGGAGGEPRVVWVASDATRTMFYGSATPGSDASAGLQLLHLSDADEAEAPALAAGPVGNGEALVTVSRDTVRVYTPDLQPLQTLPLPVALDPRAHAPHVSFTHQGLVVHCPVAQKGGGGGGGPRARTAPLLLRWSPSKAGLVPVVAEGGAEEAPVFAHGVSGTGARAAVFCDRLGRVELVRPRVTAAAGTKSRRDRTARMDEDEDEDDLYGESTREAQPREKVPDVATRLPQVVDPREVGCGEGEPWEWVAEVDAQGDLTIRLLPSGEEIFSSTAVSLFPDVLEDQSTERFIPTDIDEDDVKVERVAVAYLGPTGRETIHLLILLTNGQLAVYEAFPSRTAVPAVSPSMPRIPRLAARWVKTLVRHIPSTPVRRNKASTDADLPPPPRRDLVPFTALASAGAAVLLTGEEAVWLVKGAHGPARAVDHGERGVYAAVELGGGQQQDERGGEREGNEMAIHTREGGLVIARLPAGLTLDTPIPYTHVPMDRVYAHLAFDLESGLYVGATLNETRFVAFDEEGQPMWKERDPTLVEPTSYRSTLELLTPGQWQAIHGYEFRQNEFVTSLKSVSLASQSSATGQRDFVAVGTAVYRAEDLATKGGIYIFEVVAVNAHPLTPKLTHQLRLLFFEDAKAAVNNVCDLNGYLFLSMGQKLYARAFEQDEFLLAVGFLDVGMHVKSLVALKNFLLIGDEQQSVSLVAFQEDPYKLVLLGRDYRPSRVGGANFIVNEGKVAFVSNDDAGNLRLFEYDPTNIASYAGQRLLCRTEFHAGSESQASMLFAKHAPGEDAKQNGILYGGLDGSLSTVVPVRDAVFRRLQSLQTTMTRHVLHFAGLNPRGYRIVKNDSVSRAIVKGILDGDLLSTFETLPLEYQNDLAGAVGTDADTVRANLRNLRGFE